MSLIVIRNKKQKKKERSIIEKKKKLDFSFLFFFLSADIEQRRKSNVIDGSRANRINEKILMISRLHTRHRKKFVL